MPVTIVRPDPTTHLWTGETEDGTHIVCRPIALTDTKALAAMHTRISSETVRHRYGGYLSLESRTESGRLKERCTISDTEFALVVEIAEEIVGVGRLSIIHQRDDAEVAFLVVDHEQGHGIGHMLVETILCVAQEMELRLLRADFAVAPDPRMLKLLLNKKFRSIPDAMTLDLADTHIAA